MITCPRQFRTSIAQQNISSTHLISGYSIEVWPGLHCMVFETKTFLHKFQFMKIYENLNKNNLHSAILPCNVRRCPNIFDWRSYTLMVSLRLTTLCSTPLQRTFTLPHKRYFPIHLPFLLWALNVSLAPPPPPFLLLIIPSSVWLTCQFFYGLFNIINSFLLFMYSFRSAVVVSWSG